MEGEGERGKRREWKVAVVCLSSRPKGRSWPRELCGSRYIHVYMCMYIYFHYLSYICTKRLWLNVRLLYVNVHVHCICHAEIHVHVAAVWRPTN